MKQPRRRGMAYQGNPATNDWQTPTEIVDALGPFDLDPCASVNQITPTATTMWSTKDGDSLLRVWQLEHFIWMNPPYDRYQIGSFGCRK